MRIALASVCALCAGLPALAGANAGLARLSVRACERLQVDSSFDVKLPEAWSTYKAQVRVCPLRRTSRSKAEVFLIAVFVDDYYAAHPDQRTWKEFPHPLLVAPDGRCLATLPEQFPSDEPRRLTLSFGQWIGSVPSRIAVHVANPAVGGSYRFPTMAWDKKSQRYLAIEDTDEHKRGEFECPKAP